MDEKFNTVLSVALIPKTVALIAKEEGLDELSAMNLFYRSKVYALLSREETKLWHYSPLTLCQMWKKEQETGDVVFPEE